MMTIQKDLVLTHGSVQLRTLNPDDLDLLSQAASDPLIWPYESQPLINQELFQKYWFDKAIQKLNAQERWPFVMIYQGEIAGSSSFYHLEPAHKRLALGYTWINPKFWGTNLNSISKFLLLNYAFEDLKMSRVEFFVDQDNQRSQKALKKLGAIQEGILRKHMIRPNGTSRNSVIFSITDQDWPELKIKLLGAIS